MLERTIQKKIIKKIKSWLHSIKDKNIVEAIKKDLIVSGGCFVSMIQNEDVNDYDCYFRTKATASLVARYYLEQMDGYNKICDRVKIEEDRVKIFIKSNGILSNKYTEKDKEAKIRYKPVFVTSNAITLSHDIQLIMRFSGEAEELHKNFDFIHTKSFYDYHNAKLVIPKSVYESIMNKRLIFTNSKYPVCSLFRLKKFMKRGWNISAGEIFKISYGVSKLDLNNIEVLKEQLIGVDSLYFCRFIQLLQDQPERIEESVIMEMINKVFVSIEE